MHTIFDEYKIAFLEETQEHLIMLNDDLIALEKNPSQTDLIDSIFRVLHTLKSSAAAVGFNELSQFAHRAEDLVQQIRNKQRKITPKLVNLLFQVFDNIQAFINLAQSDHADNKIFSQVLRQLMAYKSRKGRKNIRIKPEIPASASVQQLPAEIQTHLNQKTGRDATLYEISVCIDTAEPIKWLRSELILNHAKKLGEIVAIVPDKSSFQSIAFDGRFKLFLSSKQNAATIQKKITIDLMKIENIQVLSPNDMTNSNTPQSSQVENNRNRFNNYKQAGKTNTIRVPIKKLDSIMHLVGELVVANSALKILENQIHNIHRDDPISHEMNLIVDKFSKLSTSLQSRVLNTRMMPIYILFNQYNRVVRDLSQKESKEIDLLISGGETELDKKVIDAMGDPLTHLIRNAVDHGIESPQERKSKGKNLRAKIQLSAAQAGNHILISIKDDGRGLDLNKIRTTAVEKGLLQKEAADSMAESEILNMVFEPGFSTAEKVSSVSGRGVGLDVVNNIISSLNGTVQINSRQNQGTEFLITLPLTLAISTVIVVEAGKSSYGIPINDIRETIKVPEHELNTRQCIRALNLENRVIPVLGLDQILDEAPARLPKDIHGNVPVIIVTYQEREIGLIVDRIMGKQEIVMKPLEEHYKSIRGVSGAAILGDGTVILIADVLGIIQIVRDIEKEDQKSQTTIKEKVQPC
ncbi:chemotaxis protein CheA [bacterium]|nr:chemotaxis protein CheA [bacterium]